MSALPWLILIGLVVLEAWLFAPLAADVATSISASFSEWRRRRDIVRRSAVDQEMQAQRAAQQLSLLAWRARHEMYDLAGRDHSASSVHVARRKGE